MEKYKYFKIKLGYNTILYRYKGVDDNGKLKNLSAYRSEENRFSNCAGMTEESLDNNPYLYIKISSMEAFELLCSREIY